MDHLFDQNKIKLSGFNNLTKILSFNLYDFCIATNEQEKKQYVEYINEMYSAKKIVDISQKICDTIEANVLNISMQDYDPVGASSLVLMSDLKGGKWDHEAKTPQVSMHLDKSHITAHTYPDAEDPNGICTFRVDIDIATCGEIIPLKAINTLFESFECDVVFIDYVVRGYTRLKSGRKIYNDHHFNSIQDFIRPDILSRYQYRSDINMPHDNIWQTKLLIGENVDPKEYVLGPLDSYSKGEIDLKMGLVREEMREVFHLIH